MSAWQPIETAPAEGQFLVYLSSELRGSRVHSADFGKTIKTIGCVFSFDAPKPTHWMPLPEPPSVKA